MDIIQQTPQLYLTQYPATLFDVCGAVMIGTKRVLVWDTLLHPDNMAEVPALAEGKPITVVYSHADWDHIWGTAGLPYSEVIGHSSCLDRFNDPKDVQKTLQDKQAEDTYYNAVQLVAPSRTFATTLTLDLGDVTVTLQHLPGHSKDCIVAFSPELGVLLGGDTCEDPLPVVYENSALGAWLAELQYWQDHTGVTTVIPSHGPVSTKALLANNIAYLKALREGRTPDVADQLAPFYTETHAANLARAVKGS